jgi:hypothetical protein
VCGDPSGRTAHLLEDDLHSDVAALFAVIEDCD